MSEPAANQSAAVKLATVKAIKLTLPIVAGAAGSIGPVVVTAT